MVFYFEIDIFDLALLPQCCFYYCSIMIFLFSKSGSLGHGLLGVSTSKSLCASPFPLPFDLSTGHGQSRSGALVVFFNVAINAHWF